MSEYIRSTAVDVLAPLVGPAMATVYVADALRCLGMHSEDVDPGDLAALCDVLRSKITPFAARPVVDQAMSEIVTRAGA